MKIVVRKKHLSSLSSLLVLTLMQPAANAEVSDTKLSSTPRYEASSAEQERLVKGLPLKTAYRSHGNLNTRVGELKHFAYKDNISKAFDDYNLAKNKLEEHYQDKVDQLLDEYERSLKIASDAEGEIMLAKEKAESMLAKLKQQHRAKQEALKLKYHIS